MEWTPDAWLAVLNPVSGGGRALREHGRIEGLLAARGLRFRIAVSEYAGHVTGLVDAALAAGCRQVVVAGGDGSLHQAANAILAQRGCPSHAVTLAALPVGTGNDWVKTLAIPRDWERAVDLIAGTRRRRIDAGRIDFDDGRPSCHFMNVAGIGFDAEVVRRMPPNKRGALAYLSGVLGTLAGYRPVSPSLSGDIEADAEELFVLFACLGRYCGGGMHVAPSAQPDDGLFDVVRVRRLGRLEVLANLRRLYDGTLPAHPKVAIGPARRLRLQTPRPCAIQADGELVGETPATLSVLPGALTVVAPA